MSARLIRQVVFVLLPAILAVVPAFAADNRNLAVAPAKPAPAGERRVALVIGNSNYKSAPLRNPVNDADDIAKALRSLDFAVTLKLDQDREGMARAIREFGNQLKGTNATGLFYYAGHGMQVNGRNYLLPVDADIQSEEEVPYRGVDANEVLAKMDAAKNRLNIMVLDACRNNPFARKFRSSSQGLAQMDAPSGTLVAFATAPGSVSSDGTGRNGLYTQHLLAHIGSPGVPVEQLFKQVRIGVTKATRDKQTPWESSSLKGDFYFKPGKAGETPPQQIASIAPAPASEATGATWTDPTTGMEFVWIPKGCYTMGSPAGQGKGAVPRAAGAPLFQLMGGVGSPPSEAKRESNERAHEVCVEGFWLGKYEVTVGQYKKFRPDHKDSDDKLPVNKVSWNDATAYAEWFSQKTGQTFQLPTEAEWEYAARSGTQTAYFWGDNFVEGYGNYGRSMFSGREPVGRYKPSSFGLYDMIGNVWEWTASVYDENYDGGEQRVADAGAGGEHVLRGGSWDTGPGDARSALRLKNTPDSQWSTLGFRLAMRP